MKRSAVQTLLNNTGANLASDDRPLVDASLWAKFAVKGPGAALWLREQGVAVPTEIYDTVRPSMNDLVARTGGDEFVIQSSGEADLAPRLAEACEGGDGVWPYPHEAATFFLGGPQALEVWAQTCGIDFAQQPLDRITYTRIAGVSCAILAELQDERRRYRLWVPASYAVYLWQTLDEIIADLD